MKSVSLLTVSVEKSELGNDFKLLAGRSDIKETVDFLVRKKKRNVDIPKSLVRAYYNEMSSDAKNQKGHC